MPSLTDQQLADALLTIASQVITDVPWYAVPVHGLGVVLAWDRRPGADEAIIEAIAKRQGEVVATSLDHRDVAGNQFVAVMIRPAGDLEEAAGTFRADYLLSTAPDDPIGDGDPNGPF